MAEQISATFTWEAGCGEGGHEPLVLTMSQAELEARDPELQSLLAAAKMSFAKSSTFTMDTAGPGENEYMCVSCHDCVAGVFSVDRCARARRSPGLIEFVWSHIKMGTLEVTPNIEPVDAERALEYFGFPSVVLVVPKTDPNFICKQVAYNVHRETMKAAPKIVELIQEKLLADTGGVGVHLIVDDGAEKHSNQFAETVDHVLTQYKPEIAGTTVVRFCDKVPWKFCDADKMYKILGTDHELSVALRAKVLLDVKALGGFDTKWSHKFLCVGDEGEFGHVSFVRAYRWVLQITTDKKRKSAEGIKRRKLSH